MDTYIAVMGGINVDIKGVPDQALIPATSNPGRVTISSGGVGRNIAHSLALLGVPVVLFGVVGDDAPGAQLLHDTQQAGVNIDHVEALPQQPTGTYLSILTEAYDLVVAIASMKITHQADAAYLNAHWPALQQSAFVIADTNLDSEVLQMVLDLCQSAEIPCLIEPVSVAKAHKLQTLTGCWDYITPNRAELAALSSRSVEDDQAMHAACVQLSAHYRHILITLGAAGVYHYDVECAVGRWYQAIPTQVRDTTGAGDAFVAGVVCGLFRNCPLDESILFGMAAASLTLQSEQTVNPRLSYERCAELLRLRYAA